MEIKWHYCHVAFQRKEGNEPLPLFTHKQQCFCWNAPPGWNSQSSTCVGSGSHKPTRTGIRRDIKVRGRNREKLAASLLIYLLWLHTEQLSCFLVRSEIRKQRNARQAPSTAPGATRTIQPRRLPEGIGRTPDQQSSACSRRTAALQEDDAKHEHLQQRENSPHSLHFLKLSWKALCLTLSLNLLSLLKHAVGREMKWPT